MSTFIEVTKRLAEMYGADARVRLVDESMRVDLGNLDEVVTAGTLQLAAELTAVDWRRADYAVEHTLKNWRVIDCNDTLYIEPEIVDESPNQVSIIKSHLIGMGGEARCNYDEATNAIHFGDQRIAFKVWNGHRSVWREIPDEVSISKAPFTASDLNGLLTALPDSMQGDGAAVAELIHTRLCF